MDLKFGILSISEPDDKYDFVPLATKTICIKINTALDNTRLNYSLINTPDDMTIDNMGCIKWSPPLQEDGKRIDINVHVTDGDINEEISFSRNVAHTIPLASEIIGNSVVITQSNSKLNGMKITPSDNTTPLDTIKLRKVAGNILPPPVTPLSEIFVTEEGIGRCKIEVPTANLSNLNENSVMTLYDVNDPATTFGEYSDVRAWNSYRSSDSYDFRDNPNYISIECRGIAGLNFIYLWTRHP